MLGRILAQRGPTPHVVLLEGHLEDGGVGAHRAGGARRRDLALAELLLDGVDGALGAVGDARWQLAAAPLIERRGAARSTPTPQQGAEDAGGDSEMIADGGRIAKTQSAVVLEKLISQFLFDKAQQEGGK